MSNLVHQRRRERLSEAIAGQRNASTLGVRKVIQRDADGAVLSDRTGWWSFDMGDAGDATESTPCPSGATLVPTETARSRIVELMTADLKGLIA